MLDSHDDNDGEVVIDWAASPAIHRQGNASAKMKKLRKEICDYLQTGDHDMLFSAWPGTGVIDRVKTGSKDLADALIAKLRSHESQVVPVDYVTLPDDLVAFTRKKVTPMVKGLFPRSEQDAVLRVLEKSLAFLTTETIETLIHETDPSTAWIIANAYLDSIKAQRISEEAPSVVGVSVEARFYVSLHYFSTENPFADYIVHEAAHVFHNTKRISTGLAETRKRQWLLPIAFGKRETFAYSCEAYSRIRELSTDPTERRARLSQHKHSPPLLDDSVDLDEYFAILDDAIERRNGWKVILNACRE